MAFKAINDTTGPDSLVPTLLVYGAYPRMTEHDSPLPTVTQRAMVVKKAMAALEKLRAQRQVADALRQRNGPTTDDIRTLALNSDVLVWREGNTGQPGSWKGPYKLVSIDHETCVLAMPNGNTSFRITSVKPFYTTQDTTIEEPQEEHTEPQAPTNSDTIIVQPTKRPRRRPWK